MQLALEEGRKGLGQVHPNPPVGCVIVNSDNNVVGRGAHLEYGSHHAEINALNTIVDQSDIDGATVYVTLEPCAHKGKTPSCAKTFAKLPIKKVVYAVADPNPLVSGKGADILRQAGKEVEILEDVKIKAQCEVLAEIFLWNMRKNSPFVALKAATSRNGSLTPDAEEKWITSKESRAHVHFLRSQYDAVLVGVDTYLKDDPSLNIRMPNFPEKENYAVVMDSTGRGLAKLKNSNLYKCRKPENIIWVTENTEPNDLGIRQIKKSGLSDLLKGLWDMDIKSLFIEGGAKVYGSFLNEDLVNRIYQYSSKADVSEENMLNWLAYSNTDIAAVGPIENLSFGDDDYQSFLLRT